ncbi:hypothetical protein NMG60_11015891 [Bertholletia excelsa]
MRAAMAPLVVLFVFAAATMPTVQSFSCSNNGVTCNGLVGYVSPNTTTLSEIASMFGIQDSLHSLLGANNWSLSLPANQTVRANQTINIPFPCLCTNGSGRPKEPPVYKVLKGDILYHIAAEVFSRLVTFQQIQLFNNMSDPNEIEIGQELKIPLPCSCDEVEGERVVHYGYVVPYGQTVEEIAQKFKTTNQTLLQLNGLASPKDLLGGVSIDVPLKACTSNVSGKSLDYPLLVSDGTTAFTAGNCVMCSCNAATNNWTLNCQPSHLTSSIWDTCPSMKCEANAEALYLGNTTSSGCNRSTCAYAGYTDTTILTVLSSDYTCQGNNDSGAKLRVQGWSWSLVLVLLCFGSIQ